MEGGAGHGRGPRAAWTVTTSSCEPPDTRLAQGHSELAFYGYLNSAALQLEVTTHGRVLPSPMKRAVSGGWKETFCAWAEWKGCGGGENQRAQLVFYKAFDGTKPLLGTQV